MHHLIFKYYLQVVLVMTSLLNATLAIHSRAKMKPNVFHCPEDNMNVDVRQVIMVSIANT